MAGTTSAARLLVDAEQPPVAERGVVFLVGGYDGSGNYGDMVQLQAALELLAAAVPQLTPIPVLELEYRESHVELAAASPQLGTVPACFYTEDWTPAPEGMRPLELSPELLHGGVYLYGGGYLNAWWGAHKLAMARAAETAVLLAGAPRLRPLASGVQVEPAWAESLGERDAELLRRLDPFGVRDEGSVPGFAASALLTGDDAVGVLAAHAGAAAAAQAPDGPLRVNVHLQDQEWVTEDGEPHLAYVGELLERLAERDGGLAVQPVIAYDDRRISERPLTERLAAHPVLGPHVEEPVVLRPGDLDGSLALLARARLTISCSYHVALTSHLLGVPAALLAGTPYYEQKAAGLAADFGLPDAFTVRPATPAAEAAERLTSALEGEDELRTGLDEGARRMLARRRDAERAVADGLTSGIAEASRDVGHEALLAGLRADHAELLAAAEGLREEMARREAHRLEREAAFDRVWGELVESKETVERLNARIYELEMTLHHERQEAARLQNSHHAMASSRTWRLTEPLRGAARRLRRR